MWKKFLARAAQRKKDRAGHARRAAVYTLLGLEVLEDRVTPAPAPIPNGPPLLPVVQTVEYRADSGCPDHLAGPGQLASEQQAWGGG
jgi:hypothetical protein